MCLDFDDTLSTCRKDLPMDRFSAPASSDTSQRKVISVSELNRQAKRLLEISFLPFGLRAKSLTLFARHPATGISR